MNQVYTYQEALEASTEYFGGDELAARVFVDKYSLRDANAGILEKAPEQMHRRIAKEFARIEKNKFKKPLTEDEIFDLMDKFKYIIPQGSPMAGIGNKTQVTSLSNCYVIPSPEDSYGGIMQADEQLVQISKRRGGCGLDISNLRPNGAATKNAARTSTGIISFMDRYSHSIREVGQEGRRGALMITCSVHHPQIMDFATIKNDPTKVNGANISIRLSDEFLSAVTTDGDVNLRWPVESTTPTISKYMKAKELWKTIIHSAWLRAEPGLLFWDKIVSESPADCYADVGFKTISTNPCSEITLSAYDSCRLLVLNLYSYVKNPFTPEAKFDYVLFKKHAVIAQRLMDDLIDLELEAIDGIIKKVGEDPEGKTVKQTEINLWKNIKKVCADGRRTGTGFTALGDTLAALGIRYGSEDSITTAEEIYRVLKLGAYRSSVDMAIELGAFPVWNHEKEKNNPFLKRLLTDGQNKDSLSGITDVALWDDMAIYGRRNIALLTLAPVGSVSLLTQTTSGVEPLFNLKTYTRRKKINPSDKDARVDFVDANNDSWQEFTIYHNKFSVWSKVTGKTNVEESPWFGACAEDLDWPNRVRLQAAIQKHCDHAISSTLNLPENVAEEKVAEIYEAAWKYGCKGVTIYRNNCRTGVMVTEKTKEVKVDVYAKRPKALHCDIYHPRVKGKEYFVIVGFDANEKPYEVFAGNNGFISKSQSEGEVVKVKRGHYSLKHKDEVVVDNITEHLKDDEEALTRMVSMSLRHNVDLPYVVHQLEKVEGDLTSLSKAVARSLKKYIQDGTAVKGEECGECHQDSLVRENGCVICKNCGWTKCS